MLHFQLIFRLKSLQVGKNILIKVSVLSHVFTLEKFKSTDNSHTYFFSQTTKNRPSFSKNNKNAPFTSI